MFSAGVTLIAVVLSMRRRDKYIVSPTKYTGLLTETLMFASSIDGQMTEEEFDCDCALMGPIKQKSIKPWKMVFNMLPLNKISFLSACTRNSLLTFP
jgi:hypothetical protein